MCRYRLLTFDQRGHGFTSTGQDADLSAEVLTQVKTLLAAVMGSMTH